MKILDGFHSRIALAMAGKNPWGSSSDDSSGGDSNGDDGGSDAPNGGKGGDRPKGPRNPWLPQGGSDGGPRRSASIEDIFKNRGPEGPRRRSGGGGPGGPNFRMPERPGGGSWVPVIIVAVAVIWACLLYTSPSPRDS